MVEGELMRLLLCIHLHICQEKRKVKGPNKTLSIFCLKTMPIKQSLVQSLHNKETLNSLASRSQGGLVLLKRSYVYSAFSAVGPSKGIQGLIPWKILIPKVTRIIKIDRPISSKTLKPVIVKSSLKKYKSLPKNLPLLRVAP